MESSASDPSVSSRTPKEYVVFFLSEFVGTAILMYIGCLGCILEVYKPIQPLVVASTFAFAIIASIQAVGHISGPQINPGVTLGLFLMGRNDWKKVLVFLAAQYTGAFFGYSMLWIQMPESSKDLKPCALTIHPFTTPLKVFFLEFSASMILILCVGGATDKANLKWHDSEGLRLGFIIYGLVMALGEVSGACLNSARAFPSAFFNNVYDYHYVYHLGPILGQCFGGVVYRFAFDTRDRNSLNKQKQPLE